MNELRLSQINSNVCFQLHLHLPLKRMQSVALVDLHYDISVVELCTLSDFVSSFVSDFADSFSGQKFPGDLNWQYDIICWPQTAQVFTGKHQHFGLCFEVNR